MGRLQNEARREAIFQRAQAQAQREAEAGAAAEQTAAEAEDTAIAGEIAALAAAAAAAWTWPKASTLTLFDVRWATSLGESASFDEAYTLDGPPLPADGRLVGYPVDSRASSPRTLYFTPFHLPVYQQIDVARFEDLPASLTEHLTILLPDYAYGENDLLHRVPDQGSRLRRVVGDQPVAWVRAALDQIAQRPAADSVAPADAAKDCWQDLAAQLSSQRPAPPSSLAGGPLPPGPLPRLRGRTARRIGTRRKERTRRSHRTRERETRMATLAFIMVPTDRSVAVLEGPLSGEELHHANEGRCQAIDDARRLAQQTQQAARAMQLRAMRRRYRQN